MCMYIYTIQGVGFSLYQLQEFFHQLMQAIYIYIYYTYTSRADSQCFRKCPILLKVISALTACSSTGITISQEIQKKYLGVEPKIGKHPKMDGENKWKTPLKWMIWGKKTLFFDTITARLGSHVRHLRVAAKKTSYESRPSVTFHWFRHVSLVLTGFAIIT